MILLLDMFKASTLFADIRTNSRECACGTIKLTAGKANTKVKQDRTMRTWNKKAHRSAHREWNTNSKLSATGAKRRSLGESRTRLQIRTWLQAPRPSNVQGTDVRLRRQLKYCAPYVTVAVVSLCRHCEKRNAGFASDENRILKSEHR